MARTLRQKTQPERTGTADAVADQSRFRKKVRRRRQLPRGEHGGVKLLLVETVPHVGQQGDVVEVKPGYGRNFLIPQGLATHVTPETLIRVQKHKAKLEAMRIAQLAELKRLAKELESLSVTIEANANEDGHLYGSVTAIDIAGALEREKVALEPDQIRLEGPIKELGLYHVAVSLGEEIQTEIKVWVVPTAGQPAAR